MPREFTSPAAIACLVGLATDVIDAVRGTRLSDGRRYDLEPLAVKILGHAASALHLARGTPLPGPGGTPARSGLHDPASTLVIARAAVDTYIAFHHVFVETWHDVDRFTLRYTAWRLAGHASRADAPVLRSGDTQARAARREEMERLRAELRSNRYYQALPENAQHRIADGKEWRFRESGVPGASITELTDRIFGPKFGAVLYRTLSSWAHADGSAAAQLRGLANARGLEGLVHLALWLIAVPLAMLVLDYHRLFPAAVQPVLDADPEAAELARTWAEFPDVVAELATQAASDGAS